MDEKSFKNRHKPYLRARKDADTAILLVHGIYGSPVQFEQLAQKLYRHGYTVMAILLPGHGSSVKDFSRAKAKDWHGEVSRAAKTLKKSYKNIYMIGHSMGGLLIINEALKSGVKGVVLMSVPMKVKISLGTVRMSLKILWGNPDKDNDYLRSYRNAYSIQKGPIWHYILCFPRMINLLQLIRNTRKSLCKVAFPVLVIQSRQDETVSWRSVAILKKGLNCSVDTLLLDKSGHSYYHPEEADSINNKICTFIKRFI